MRHKITAFCGMALLFALVANAQGPTQPRIDSYSLTIVKYPDTENSFLCAYNSVNEPHRAVGYGWNGAAVDMLGAIPFEWRDGVFTTLELLPGYPGAMAFSQNNRGDVIGSANGLYPDSQDQIQRPVLWKNGEIMDLGLLLSPEDVSAWGSGINNRDQVTINSIFLLPPYEPPYQFGFRSFLWEKGELSLLPNPIIGETSTSVGNLNDAGKIAGTSFGPNFSQQATLWYKGQGMLLGTLGGTWSGAYSINNKGQVVGLSATSNGEIHGFLWDNGVMQDLGTLGSPISSAGAVNDSTQVVGSSYTATWEEHAFVWDNGQMLDLNLVTPHDSDIVLTRALAINNRGYISGLGYDNTDPANPRVIGFLLTPEP